ncbi:acyltransferase domain-containing protein [Amycolatopsis keratiniphila]|uniref:acyltransferase domain-containing protein n=1 Tax=Amycolatopsis keratiniphila TaxID=129921 RepID=UPI0005C21508|nr:acyltransferase domain-containing protein [Amycolatopsis keratiniphila]
MQHDSLTSTFLFPGQGAYLAGVFSACREAFPVIADELSQVDEYSLRAGGPAVASLLTDPASPTLDRLLENDVPALSLAIFASQIVAARLCREEFGLSPALLVGHSFGEFAALVVSGALTLEEGVTLVVARDRALRASGASGGMVAVEAGFRRVEHLVAAVADRSLSIAADNAYDQVVVSGTTTAVAHLAAVAGALGVKATVLRVPYPFHNHQLLGRANELFARTVTTITPRVPRIAVHSPVLGRRVETPGDVLEVLSSHLVRPVRFLDALHTIRGEGETRFAECGARSTLVDLATTTLAGISTSAPFRRRADDTGVLAEVRALDAGAETARPMPDPQPAAPAPVPAAQVPTPAPVAVTPAPAEPVVEPVPAQRATSASGEPAGEEGGLVETKVLGELKTLYADAVGYPADVFEDNVELEADLGIDSIRQTELLQRARKRYDVPEADHIRITDYTTLESIAGLIVELSHQGARV